ncbi:uncharacterized protein A1O5_06343 [Cladophialophora psammophila CBS 110553]|uniref:DUF6603 domain-containing protein n=1 Tax=Cladophialophora psammophila CBS 110553 TaxID=1182543 RepID=W9WYW8_9EURO|nr:uncharacterized protein A1O5_06343 [Cladophialophora psammophila CBS 110553]EXJ70275.1 hypothetical protein A1O5_06343 [Cladophialophora psammophila CBS 110553]
MSGSGTPPGQRLSIQSPYFSGLTFDTNENQNRFSDPELDVGDSLLLALSANLPPNLNMTVDSVLTQFGILPEHRQNHELVSDVLQALGSSLSLTLDASQQRNAMWLTPGTAFRSDTALCFTLSPSDDILERLKKAVFTMFNFQLPHMSLMIYLQRTSFGTQFSDSHNNFSWNISSSYSLTFKLAIKSSATSNTDLLDIWLNLTLAGTSYSITQSSNGDFWSGLASIGGDNPGPSVMPVSKEILSDFVPVKMSLGKNAQGQNWWGVTIILQWKNDHDDGSAPVQLYLTYDSESSTISGGLVSLGFYASALDRKLNTYQIGDDLDAPENQQPPPQFWDVTKLSKVLDSLPKGLPTAIALASVSYSNNSLFFAAQLVNPSPYTPDIPFPITWDSLEVEIIKSASTFDWTAGTLFTLHPRPDLDETPYPPATLVIDVSYTGAPKTWQLSGHVENLQFGILAGYFPAGLERPMLAVLGKLAINSLDVAYTFGAANTPSSMYMTGDIVIAGLELIFNYQYASSAEENPAASKVGIASGRLDKSDLLVVKPEAKDNPHVDWSFEAYLGSSQTGSNIGSIADSIVDGASGVLPDFVSFIKIDPPAQGKSAVSLKISKTIDGAKKKILFGLNITIGLFQVTFVQVCGDGQEDKAKQLLRVSVDTLPGVKDIPMVEELTQPFQKLEYHWVRDKNGSGGSGGFTEAELQAINTKVLPTWGGIMYKSTTSERKEVDGNVVDQTGSTAKAAAIVMAAGHHFVVVENNVAVLDHCFNNAKSGEQPKGPAKEPSSTKGSEASGGATDSSEKDEDPQPTKGTLQKKTQFLTISGLALQFKSGYLWITLDANVTLGPMSVSLLGLGIGVPMSAVKLDKLSSLAPDDLKKLIAGIKSQLHGMALTFNKPPILIAGVFDHDTTVENGQTRDYYRGGLAITVPPYRFMALGEHSVVTKGTTKYNSVFMYGRLDGPILTLEIASIKGIRVGYGVNTIIRQPAGDELYNFPLIADTGASTAGNNPAQILNVLLTPTEPPHPPWIDVKQDSWWFALGLTLDACDIMDITAMVMVSFKDPAVVFNFLGDAVVQLPSKDGPPEESLLYVQMNIVAEMNVVWQVNQIQGVPLPVPVPTGFFRVEAALAPTSFVLVPFCHLSGGYAARFWFGIPNVTDHVGDFVFSMGGYHPIFQVPTWYPTVQRLGISMTVGDCINITGEAYFAITPKVAMLGAMLHASLDVGPVSAYFDALFDAMINFYPVHYRADISISVGVKFQLDFLFVHIHVSCHVGAGLHIEGPDFGGKAHVDFYLFGFDIYFGKQNDIPKPLSLADFYLVVHKPDRTGPNLSSQSISRQIDPEMCNLVFALEDGAFIIPVHDLPKPTPSTADPPAPNTGASSVWNVKGGTFQFRVSTEIPISQAFVLTPSPPDPALPMVTEGTPNARVVSTPASDPLNMPPTPKPKAAEPSRLPVEPIIPLNPVYAKPMQLYTGPSKTQAAKSYSLTSELTFCIKDARGKLVDNLQISYIRKSMPTSIWGAYNPLKDPNLVSAEDATDGLDNTVDLAMAVSIHSPPPMLSKSPIPAFNATAASRLQIPRTTVTEPDGATVGLPWQIPTPDPVQSEGLPTEDLEADKPAVKRWADVQDTWNGSYKSNLVGDGTDEGILAIFANQLGWDQADVGPVASTPTASSVGQRKPWQLVGGVPEVVVGDGKDRAKGLAEYYLALPRLSDGVGI